MYDSILQFSKFATSSLVLKSGSSVLKRGLCSTVSQNEYETVAEDTLHRLSDYFDYFADNLPVSEQFDVSNAMGVLTVVVSKTVGTYVINKQSPNKQIWLSSPISGPKRYDLVEKKRWVYSHDGETLDELLNCEFRKIFGDDTIDFSKHI